MQFRRYASVALSLLHGYLASVSAVRANRAKRSVSKPYFAGLTIDLHSRGRRLALDSISRSVVLAPASAFRGCSPASDILAADQIPACSGFAATIVAPLAGGREHSNTNRARLRLRRPATRVYGMVERKPMRERFGESAPLRQA